MRKNVLRRAKGALGRVAAAGLAAVLALGVAMSGPVAASALEATPGGSLTTADGVTLTKLASWDETTADRANVQLSVGSTESRDKVAVMFLLDKSTSQGMRDEAAEMLDYLSEKSNTDIIYNVVIFSGTATSTGWQDIADDATLDATKANFVNKETTSGTDMDAGIEAASAQMSQIPADYVDAETYLVTLSDGITYVWSEDGNVMTVPVVQQRDVEDANPGEISLNDGTSAWDTLHSVQTGGPTESMADIYGSFANFLANVTVKMDASRNAGYVREYQSGYSVNDPSLLRAYIYNEEANKKQADTYAIGPEFAVYESATGYAALEAMFDHSYAFATPEQQRTEDGTEIPGTDNTSNWDMYPWGLELMQYCNSLSDNAGQSSVSNATPENVFAGIQDEILYEIQSGTVNDTIGADFDLAGLETIKLTVGGVDIPGTVDAENNTVTFDGGNYVVTYNPNASAGETLTWDIKLPVKSAEPVTLSYALDLSNKATEAGTYQVPTNEDASIFYKSTDGNSGAEKFPVPVLEYTVEEPAPVTPDPITVSGDVFNVTKVLEGATLKDGQFEFQLADADGNVIATATNDAEGNVVFDGFTFEAAGTYEYTVSEVLPTDDDPNTDGVQKDGVTYDQTVEGLKLEVTEKDGKLTYQAYTDEDGATFNNVYKAAKAPAEDTKPADDTKKDETVPSTGDPTSFAAVAATLVAGVGAGAAGIAMRRRNK